MATISLLVNNDENINKYIAIIRKKTGKSIAEIKANITSNSKVIICDYYDKEGLKNLSDCIMELNQNGSQYLIYEDERQITFEMLINLIKMFEEITKDREEIDDLMLEDR